MTERIVILTGAGISAESGLGTFRDMDGLWTRVNIEDVATPEAFARDPERVLDFYNSRRAGALGAAPNDAHFAIARLEREWPGEVLVVTQNVDALHERAGSLNVLHMHGRLDQALCVDCGDVWEAPAVMRLADACPACSGKTTRPDIVWFGETPYHMDGILEALSLADLFVAIGTSGAVYPAAGFAAASRRFGAHTLELNLQPSDTITDFAEARHGPATKVVPGWVDGLLSGR